MRSPVSWGLPEPGRLSGGDELVERQQLAAQVLQAADAGHRGVDTPPALFGNPHPRDSVVPG